MVNEKHQIIESLLKRELNSAKISSTKLTQNISNHFCDRFVWDSRELYINLKMVYKLTVMQVDFNRSSDLTYFINLLKGSAEYLKEMHYQDLLVSRSGEPEQSLMKYWDQLVNRKQLKLIEEIISIYEEK